MRLYIPDMDDMFACLDSNSWPYVVLRGFDRFVSSYPNYGSKEDIDLLVDNIVINDLLQRYSRVSRRKGIKCDIYAPTSHEKTDYLGHAYYPRDLSKNILINRVKWRNKFYVPSPEDHFYSLLYHVAYHKAERSGYHLSDPEAGKSTKYYKEFEGIRRLCGLDHDYTLTGAHYRLAEKGYNINDRTLASYIQHNFERGRKSIFYGWLCNQRAGEMNLFVIRRTAVIHNKHIEILKILKKRYKILAIKKVSLITRLREARHMRGGKWRRGGKPYIAIVVFDPAPVEASSEERQVHKHVFNRNQFFKPELREWFTSSTNARKSDNPLHSTDNEAEAIGHLPLFFNEEEQKEIFTRLAYERDRLGDTGL